MGGKRYANSSQGFDFDEINYKKIFITIGIILAVITIGIVSVYFIKNRKPKEKQVVSTPEIQEKMPKQYEGYDVLGKIVIEKINLDTYILDSVDNKAMDKAPVKLYGKTLNQEGNFCIAGHNYDEIFARLVELEVGDEFYIEDVEGIIQDYKITEILDVEPTDLTPLMPIDDKIQVTLITCKEGATERLVIKAERINIEVNEEDTATEDTNEG